MHLVIALLRSFTAPADFLPSLLLAAVLTGVCVVVTLTTANRSVSQLLMDLDWLVPIGFYFIAKDVLEWTSFFPAARGILNASLITSYTISLHTVISLLIDAAFCCYLVPWLMNQIQRTQKRISFTEMKIHFWRFLATGVVVTCLLYGLIAISLPIGLALLSLRIPGVALTFCFIALEILLFNFVLVYVYPAMMDRSSNFFQCLFRSFRIGIMYWKQFFPLVLYLVVLGSVPRVSFSIQGSNYNASFNYNLSWVGGFPISSKWEELFNKSADFVTVPIVSAYLQILFLATSIGIVFEICSRISKQLQTPDSENAIGDSNPPD